MLKIFPILIFLLTTLSSCVTYDSMIFQRRIGVRLVDSAATRETVILFHNLKILSQNSIIFGHQNSSQYGVLWYGDTLRSDVRDVTGSFPGLYGWDFESILRKDPAGNDDRIPNLVKDAYSRGAVNTFSWHAHNPVTGNSHYDTSIAVKYILPGGKYFLRYLCSLDTLAEYSKSLRDDEGNPIPIIFRPFHEFDGDWFWWGKKYCTREEFIALWKLTVDYLRQCAKAGNILYTFSSDRHFDSEAEYLDRYPGDDYVDIIGMDNYHDFTFGDDPPEKVQQKLKIISALAVKKQKIAAFTETGSELIPDSTWWTTKLYRAIDSDSIKIAYVMLWRNANPKHFYVPYRGQKSESDFMEFRKKSKMLFEEDLPDMYGTVLPKNFIVQLQNRNSKKRIP
jgi:mannan endo-1,4-beta-mannosidase